MATPSAEEATVVPLKVEESKVECGPSEIGKQRVCIIGAGPSGLSVLHAFAEAKRKGLAVPEYVCYERQRDWGGQWLFSPYSGLDEYGEPVHSCMYYTLWGNSCKEGLEFADYSFEEHFGRPIPSYPPRAVLADYIMGRAKKSEVRESIKFNTPVRMVKKVGSQYSVTVEDLTNDETEESLFDYVIVAVGHFWSPHLPKIPGIETFPGRVIHAREYRRSAQFAGQTVCLVGASYSAEDIAIQILMSGGKSVVMSYRNERSGIMHPPDGFSQQPEIINISGSELTFKDGSKMEVDSIIYCTGYEYKFPFLNKELRISDKLKSYYVKDLFKGVVYVNEIDEDRKAGLFYIGMQDQWYTFTMFDAEAWFARDVILGRIKLPSDEDIQADMARWRERMQGLKNGLEELDFQRDYIIDLMSQVEDFPKYDCEGAAKQMRIFRKAKFSGILTFRDTEHVSAVTGNKQGRLAKKWQDMMYEDSIEAYLRLIV